MFFFANALPSRTSLMLDPCVNAPPWTQTKTGRLSPAFAVVQTFRNRQSSLWGWSGLM